MKYRFSWFIFFMGCTDYQFKNIGQGNEQGDRDSSTTDTESNTTENQESTPNSEEDPINEEPNTEDSCTEGFVLFDIEEVSTLQDAVSYSVANWTHDAVLLNFDDTQLEPEQTWRVSAVEILVLISEAHFEYFTDGQEINIIVFDASNPTMSQPWTMTKQIVRSEHNWIDYTLPQDAWHASLYGEFAQKGVWLRFDTTTVIPESGMTSGNFIVGVMWNPPGMVKVGYSNFNQDCERNWSDYGSGWELNSLNPEYFGCSWPMLHVEIETRMPGDCD
jgi:hypothetical protein